MERDTCFQVAHVSEPKVPSYVMIHAKFIVNSSSEGLAQSSVTVLQLSAALFTLHQGIYTLMQHTCGPWPHMLARLTDRL